MRNPDSVALFFALLALAVLFSVPWIATLLGHAVPWNGLVAFLFGVAGVVFGWAAVSLRLHWRSSVIRKRKVS